MTKATYFPPFCFQTIFTTKVKKKVLCFFLTNLKKYEKFQEKIEKITKIWDIWTKNCEKLSITGKETGQLY